MGEEAHECVWYAALNHQLMDLFATDYKITVMPKYHLPIKKSDFNNRSDSVKHCVPDFCVAKYKFTRTASISFSDYHILIILKSMPTVTGSHNFQRNLGNRSGNRQGFLSHTSPGSKTIGVMITIGVFWSFHILKSKAVIYPDDDELAFNPPDSLPSLVSDGSEEDGVRAGFYSGIVLRVTRPLTHQCDPGIFP